jgi:hypothetical protein
MGSRGHPLILNIGKRYNQNQHSEGVHLEIAYIPNQHSYGVLVNYSRSLEPKDLTFDPRPLVYSVLFCLARSLFLGFRVRGLRLLRILDWPLLLHLSQNLFLSIFLICRRILVRRAALDKGFGRKWPREWGPI